MSLELPRALAEAGHQARVLGNLVRALEIVGGAYAGSTDAEHRFHLRRLTRWIAGRLQPRHDPGSLAERLVLPADVASLLDEAPANDTGSEQSTVAAVETVLVDADASGEGFLATLSVTEGAEEVAGVGASFLDALDRARQLVFRLLTRGGRFRPGGELLRGSRFRLGGPQAASAYRTDGGSIAAAAALTLFSRWTGLAIPGRVAITGCLGDAGELLPVGGLEAKVAAVLRERPLVELLVLPAGQGGPWADPRVREAETLEQVIGVVMGSEALHPDGAAAVVDVEGTVRLGLELYEKEGSFALAHDVLQTGLAGIEDQRSSRGDRRLWRVEEQLSLWRAGSCLIHLGDAEGARPLFRRATELGERLWEEGAIDPKAYLGCRGSRAVLLRDLFEYEAAEALLLDNLNRQRELRQDRRELAKTQGNLGELWTFMGRFDEAEASLKEALESLRAVYPDEVPRELCYLGNLTLRRGEPRRAVTIFDEGLAANRSVTYGRERNETFLRYGLVRAHVELSELDVAIRHADRALAPLPTHELYPRQLILKFRGLAAVGLGQLEAGEADLQAAADRTHARGSLAEIAAATALAELALVLFEIPGREPEALELVRQLLGLGGRLLQRMDPPGIELLGPPADIDGLKRKLVRWLDRFPY